MSLIPCPGCGLPRTAEDLTSLPCPLCGGESVAESPAAVAPPPAVAIPAPPPARTSRRPLWLAVAALVPIAIGAAIYLAWPKSEAELVADPSKPKSSTAVATVAVAPPPRSVAGPPPKPVAVAKPEVAPFPRVASASAVEPNRPAEGAVVLNKPDGEYVLPMAGGDEVIVLTGEVGTLRIGPVSGRARVDASKLKAKVVVVTGRVDEEATLRVRAADRIEFAERVDGTATVTAEAPGGTVRFATAAARIDGGATVHVRAARAEFVGKVDGGSRLTVDAGDGGVAFGGPNGDGKLGGGARVAVTARTVDIGCLMAGGANVAVTVVGSGRITHKDLEGGAKLTHRKASATNPDPAVSGGELRGGATVSKAE